MPSFVNTNDHVVRAGGLRLIPGQVVEVTGEQADALKGTSGVKSANSEHKEAWARQRGNGSFDGATSAKAENLAAISAGRATLRHALVAAPLRRVVGDDLAPYGPETGVVTTKGQVVGDGSDFATRQAFADHEALPGEKKGDGSLPDSALAVAPTATEVHNAQAANAASAENIAQELFFEDEVRQPDEADDDDEPEEQPAS